MLVLPTGWLSLAIKFPIFKKKVTATNMKIISNSFVSRIRSTLTQDFEDSTALGGHTQLQGHATGSTTCKPPCYKPSSTIPQTNCTRWIYWSLELDSCGIIAKVFRCMSNYENDESENDWNCFLTLPFDVHLMRFYFQTVDVKPVTHSRHRGIFIASKNAEEMIYWTWPFNRIQLRNLCSLG